MQTAKCKALVKLCNDIAVDMEITPLEALKEIDEDWGLENYSKAEEILKAEEATNE